MTTYIEFHADIETVAKKIDAEGGAAYDELFNAFGALTDVDDYDMLAWFEKHVGSELDEAGQRFLKTIADFYDRQFPGER